MTLVNYFISNDKNNVCGVKNENIDNRNVNNRSNIEIAMVLTIEIITMETIKIIKPMC